MRIFHEVSKESLSEAVAISQNQWKAISLTQRYNAVARIVKDVKKHCPDFKENPRYPVENITAFFKHNYILGQIADSIEHSTAYQDFLTQSRKRTIELISDSSFLRDAFTSVHDLSEGDIERVLWESHVCQASASNSVISDDASNIVFLKTPLNFYKEPKKYYPKLNKYKIRHGSFSGDIGTNERNIKINLHEDAFPSDIFKALSRIHHETIHDQGFQLGVMDYRGRHENLGNFKHDGEIWHIKKKERATIPSGFYNAYRRQCVEIVAFENQFLFEKELRETFSVPHARVA